MSKQEKPNFLTYAFDAARIMNDTGIKKQVKDHWRRLQEEIAKPLEPRDERVSRVVQRRRSTNLERIIL